LMGPLSNRGTGIVSESNADDAVHAFRSAYADLIGVPATGIVHGRSATALIYDFSRALAKTWGPDDEIVVSRLDHDANVRPWVQAAESAGASVRWLDIVPETAELDLESAASVIGPRTRVVALTAASNLLGTMPPVRALADLVHAVGGLMFVDGVHYTAHHPVDLAELGADLFVCSPYKCLGPHLGVLAASPDLLETIENDKLLPATNAVPERFELGTLPYEAMAGATAAVDFLAAIAPGNAKSRRDRLASSLAATDAHEHGLSARLEAGLESLPGVEVRSRAARRTPTVFFTVGERDPWVAYEFLCARNVLVGAGEFYAYEPATRLGIMPAGGLRLGMAPYTTESEVDRALEGLAEFLRS